MNVGIPPVVLKASRKHTATLIFLHGLGDTGMGWAGALNTIKPDYLKVICPTAPMLPVTLNGGMAMPAWYDILSLDENDKNREDMEGVDWSVNFIQELVKQEETQHGVKSDRVVVGGFSQGGAVSLRTALTSEIPLGGCVALSCYLPGNQDSYTAPQHNVPIFQAHGEEDSVVTFKRGQLTAEVVSRLVNNENHQFVSYPGMAHEATLEELEDVKTWLQGLKLDKNF